MSESLNGDQLLDEAMALLDGLTYGEDGCPFCHLKVNHTESCRLQTLYLRVTQYRNSINGVHHGNA